MGGGGGGIIGKVASSIFGKVPETKVPEITPPPKVPGVPGEQEPEVEAAKKKERKMSRLRQGRQSTILSNLRQQLSPKGQAGGEQLG